MMEQQREPKGLQQVIYIIKEEKENIKDAYNVKAAKALGIIHIICGLISFVAEITGFVDGFFVGTGGWASVFFNISGVLAIAGARSGKKCLVVATMVMAIISAICGGILLIMSAIFLSISYSYSDRESYNYMVPVVFGLLILMGATMLVVAITSASLTCFPLCCRPTKLQGYVHYNPNQVLVNIHCLCHCFCLCLCLYHSFCLCQPLQLQPAACHRHLSLSLSHCHIAKLSHRHIATHRLQPHPDRIAQPTNHSRPPGQSFNCSQGKKSIVVIFQTTKNDCNYFLSLSAFGGLSRSTSLPRCCWRGEQLPEVLIQVLIFFCKMFCPR